jgi:shikimate dehydrogenase
MGLESPAHLDRYVVLGNPVQHSRSPFIHAEFARQTGQAMVYERRECALDGFADAVQQLMAEGARGCNVTVPFKFDAARLAHSRSARCTLAGAANTLSFDGTPGQPHISADNSDGVGLVRDIEAGAGVVLAGSHVLLIGAGGAAAGVLGPLLAARPALLQVVNRSADKARQLVATHQAWAQQHGVGLRGGALGDAGVGFDVVLNASASSLAGVAVPVSQTVLAPGALAVDLMYGPAAAPFLAWAQAAGAQGRDGLGMLVEQAAEAFMQWRGVRPHTAPVLQALRDAMAVTAVMAT